MSLLNLEHLVTPSLGPSIASSRVRILSRMRLARHAYSYEQVLVKKLQTVVVAKAGDDQRNTVTAGANTAADITRCTALQRRNSAQRLQREGASPLRGRRDEFVDRGLGDSSSVYGKSAYGDCTGVQVTNIDSVGAMVEENECC